MFRLGGRSADPDLPLTRRDARRLRALVEQAFARHGHPVEPGGNHVRDAEGSEFGLWNLAAVCASERPADWPGIVDDHVAVVVRPRAGLDDLDDASLEAATVLRLYGRDELPPGWAPTAPALTDDLVAVPTLDLPREVVTPSEDVLARRGPLDRWREVGLLALEERARTDELHLELVAPGEPDGGIHVVLGESSYVASLALVLDTLLRRHDAADRGHGVLVVTPSRHQLAYRVVDGPGCVEAIGHLVQLAQHGFAEAPGPVSPHVHWVHEGRWTQLTETTEEGVSVHLDETLARVLGVEGEG